MQYLLVLLGLAAVAVSVEVPTDAEMKEVFRHCISLARKCVGAEAPGTHTKLDECYKNKVGGPANEFLAGLPMAGIDSVYDGTPDEAACKHEQGAGAEKAALKLFREQCGIEAETELEKTKDFALIWQKCLKGKKTEEEIHTWVVKKNKFIF